MQVIKSEIDGSKINLTFMNQDMQGSFERKEKALENLIVSNEVNLLLLENHALKSSNVGDLKLMGIRTMQVSRSEPLMATHQKSLRNLKAAKKEIEKQGWW